MTGETAVLLSIRPTYAERILSGSKRFEFRRGNVRFSVGTVLLIYATAPRREVVAWTTAVAIESFSMAAYTDYADGAGIAKVSLEKYLDGARRSSVISLGAVEPLTPPVTLADLASPGEVLTAPQRYCYLPWSCVPQAVHDRLASI